MSNHGKTIMNDQKALSAEEAQFLQTLMQNLDDPCLPKALRSATLLQVLAPLVAQSEEPAATRQTRK